MKEDLMLCAQVNFENFARACPQAAQDILFRIAKAQLDEALGGMPVSERFVLDVKRAEKDQQKESESMRTLKEQLTARMAQMLNGDMIRADLKKIQEAAERYGISFQGRGIDEVVKEIEQKANEEAERIRS